MTSIIKNVTRKLFSRKKKNEQENIRESERPVSVEIPESIEIHDSDEVERTKRAYEQAIVQMKQQYESQLDALAELLRFQVNELKNLTV